MKSYWTTDSFNFVGKCMATAILSCGFQRDINNFDPKMLEKFCNLKNLDLSHCYMLEATSLLTNIVKCSHLTHIKLVHCTQFSEQQLTKLLCDLQNLEYADCTATQEMSFCNCLLVLCTLTKLRAINVEPKYIILERKDWERMIKQFNFITFGHSVMRMFPFYGQHLKM